AARCASLCAAPLLSAHRVTDWCHPLEYGSLTHLSAVRNVFRHVNRIGAARVPSRLESHRPGGADRNTCAASAAACPLLARQAFAARYAERRALAPLPFGAGGTKRAGSWFAVHCNIRRSLCGLNCWLPRQDLRRSSTSCRTPPR